MTIYDRSYMYTAVSVSNCFLLHVHIELTDSINVTDVAVEFINANDENAPDILAVLLVLCNFSRNEIIIILFPNMIRTFPISNNEYNYHFVPFSPPKYNMLSPPLHTYHINMYEF